MSLLVIFLTFVSINANSASDGRWPQSVESAKEILSLVDDMPSDNFYKEFESSVEIVKRLPTVIEDLVKYVKSESITSQQEVELNTLRDSVNSVIKKLDSLDRSMVNSDVSWNLLDSSLPEFLSEIQTLEAPMLTFLHAPVGTAFMFEDSFAMPYLEKSASPTAWLKKLVMQKTNPIIMNIFDRALIYFKNDEIKMAKFGGFLTRLLIRRLIIDYVFQYASGYEEEIKTGRRQWEADLADILSNAKEMQEKLVDAWKIQYFVDIDEIARSRLKSMNNKQLSDEIYKFLSLKYKHQKWFVLVHKSTGGNDKDRYYDNCGNYIKAFGNKVVIVNSIDKNQLQPKIRLIDIFKKIKAIEGQYPSKAVVAKILYSNFNESDCTERKFVGAIESKAKPEVSAPGEHYIIRVIDVKRKFHIYDKSYHLIAFG